MSETKARSEQTSEDRSKREETTPAKGGVEELGDDDLDRVSGGVDGEFGKGQQRRSIR